MEELYAVKDKKGRTLKVGFFTEPEVRMAAKAGLRIFKLFNENKAQMEITEELTGLFDKHAPRRGKTPD